MRRSLFVVAVCVIALAASTTSHHQRHATAKASDAFDVYFGHDAVSRNMVRLVATTCGTERWPVKTGTDYDRNKIHQQAVNSTIKYLDSRPEPSSRPQANRIRPVEVTTYEVTASLVEYKEEDDSDYHLVLRDGRGRTMIAEIPAPSCVGRMSPERSKIVAARRWFNQHYVVTSDFKNAGQRVTVTGVGFFDYLHGQTGVAPNGIELHPVTAIQSP